jgi:hypothetical protein
MVVLKYNFKLKLLERGSRYQFLSEFYLQGPSTAHQKLDLQVKNCGK